MGGYMPNKSPFVIILTNHEKEKLEQLAR